MLSHLQSYSQALAGLMFICLASLDLKCCYFTSWLVKAEKWRHRVRWVLIDRSCCSAAVCEPIGQRPELQVCSDNGTETAEGVPGCWEESPEYQKQLDRPGRAEGASSCVVNKWSKCTFDCSEMNQPLFHCKSHFVLGASEADSCVIGRDVWHLAVMGKVLLLCPC